MSAAGGNQSPHPAAISRPPSPWGKAFGERSNAEGRSPTIIGVRSIVREACRCARSAASPLPPGNAYACRAPCLGTLPSRFTRHRRRSPLRPWGRWTPQGGRMRSPRHTFKSKQIPQGICTATRRQAHFTSPSAKFHTRTRISRAKRISLSIRRAARPSAL